MSKNYIPKQNLPEKKKKMYPVKKNSYSKLIWVSQMLISSSVCQVDHYWQYKYLPSKVTMKHIYTYLYLYKYISTYLHTAYTCLFYIILHTYYKTKYVIDML